MKTTPMLLFFAILFFAILCSCIDQLEPPSPSSPATATATQALCNEDLDNCPGGHPITRAAAIAFTDGWESAALAAAGHPEVAFSTSCTKNGNSWSCTSKGDPIWPNWPGGSSHWIESTCEVSTSGGSCYSLDCYIGGSGEKFCSPV